MKSTGVDLYKWYFAYGSNLLKGQMISRVGPFRTDSERSRIARLLNYRLTFNMLAEDGNVYANIEAPGDGVLGVIYRCSHAALDQLDAYEGGYERREIVVIDDRGIELPACAYIAQPDAVTAAGQPSDAYLRKIIAGARAHGLPEEYIHAIQATAIG